MLRKAVVSGVVLALALGSAAGQVLKGSKATPAAAQTRKVDPATKSKLASLSQTYRQHEREYQRLQQSLAKAKANKGANKAKVTEFERQLNSADSQMREIESAQQQASQLSSKSDLSETESLRLQTAMDRMSKLMATLSNILKKTSDTDQSITQNLK